MLEKLIDTEFEDEVFLLASELIYDKKNNTWNIILQPGKELVAINNKVPVELPVISEVRNNKPEVYESDDEIHYIGNSLFSTGVILIVNDKFVMLQRDNDAHVDPGKWTCPAGRCDAIPKDSCLKEFYEELAAFDQESAIFFNIPGAGIREKEIYNETIFRKKGLSLPIKEIKCNINEEYYNSRVNIVWGNETFPAGTFWSFYDNQSNTLEMRMVVRATVNKELIDSMIIEDGELFNRVVKAFPLEQIKELSLVSTMKEFSNSFTGINISGHSR